MKRRIINLLITAVAVVVAAYLIPGIQVDNFMTAIIVAIALAILNALIKPILTVLTIPITIVTLGLFLLVINAAMVSLAGWMVSGFDVDSFWSALFFSIIVSVVSFIFKDKE
ncbi:MAG: phage holin family protein [Bacteroidetes bacterium]|nr:MAG: phage holin family protein [Bacteroidota bacterium]